MTLETLIPLYGGYSLAKGDRVVFVRGAIPGEVVEAEVVEKKRDYSIADATGVLRSSEDRVEPECEVFGLCGGCHYQYIRYERQVRIKEEIVLDCLRRIGRLDIRLDAPIYDDPRGYRRRAQFKVDDRGRVGFYRPLSHRVVEFSRCMLLCSEINHILNEIKSLELPRGIREVHVISGDTSVIDIRGREVPEDFLTGLMDIKGVSGIYVNGRHLTGEQRIGLLLNDLFYFVSSGAFFQSNWRLNCRLVSMVKEFVRNVSPERVLDLYAGGGNFSLPLSGVAKEVIATEEATASYQDALFNIEYNGVDNVRFKNRKVESLLVKKRIDLVITDPPRVGMSKDAIRKIVELEPEWIIYISCNPSTLARDLNRLSEAYSVESVRVVDMFAHTFHIESISILKRKKEA